jgi:hypothetical protein
VPATLLVRTDDVIEQAGVLLHRTWHFADIGDFAIPDANGGTADMGRRAESHRLRMKAPRHNRGNVSAEPITKCYLKAVIRLKR